MPLQELEFCCELCGGSSRRFAFAAMIGDCSSKVPCASLKRRPGPSHFSEVIFNHRELSDTPRLNAFWRVAPSERLSDLAIFPAGVLPRASDFNSRMSMEVHARLLDAFFTICSMYWKGRSYIWWCFIRKGLATQIVEAI